MTRRKCAGCDKPLGSTIKKCHECGGRTRRGSRIGPEHWQILLGVGGSA